MDHALLETLRTAQRFGFFGDRPVEQAARHSMAFVHALEQIPVPVRLIDLGSGGGLPGLVVASQFPAWSVLLLDRRQKRTDFLELAVTKLGLVGAHVRCDDVLSVVEEVRSGVIAPFDVVTARGFGPPEFTLRTGLALLAPGGRVVISEPPDGDRWRPELLDELDLSSTRSGSVRVFQRRATPAG